MRAWRRNFWSASLSPLILQTTSLSLSSRCNWTAVSFWVNSFKRVPDSLVPNVVQNRKSFIRANVGKTHEKSKNLRKKRVLFAHAFWDLAKRVSHFVFVLISFYRLLEIGLLTFLTASFHRARLQDDSF